MDGTHARSRRRGFGIYYVVAVVALLGLGAVSTAGMLLHRQAARGAVRHERQAREAGESWLALAMGLVQGWANADRGPAVGPGGERLFRALRETLEAGGAEESLAFDVEPAALLGAEAPFADAGRYVLEGGRVRVHFQPPRRFDGSRFHAGGVLTLDAVVVDREGEAPSLFLSRTHRYTLTTPTVPPPFDRVVLAVEDPSSLLGRDRDRSVRRFHSRMIALHRRFGRSLGQLREARERIDALPVGLDTAPLARAVEALEGARPDTASIRVPAVRPLPRGQMLIAFPSAGRLELEELAVAERVRDAERRMDALEEALDAAEAGVEEALRAGLVPGGTLQPVEAAVGQWAREAGALWESYQAGLDIYRQLDALRVHFRERGPFAPYWGQFSPAHWRGKAHYRITGDDVDALQAKLRELAATVRPLNGIVHVANDPQDPGQALVLRDFLHGLEGRFVLACTGDVLLDGFRPQEAPTAADGDGTRVLVVAGGDVELRGEVQAAVYAEGRVRFEPGATLRGGLYAREVFAPSDWRGGALEPLADAAASHRFRARAGGGLRDGALLVAIDPFAVSKEVRAP